MEQIYNESSEETQKVIAQIKYMSLGTEEMLGLLQSKTIKPRTAAIHSKGRIETQKKQENEQVN